MHKLQLHLCGRKFLKAHEVRPLCLSFVGARRAVAGDAVPPSALTWYSPLGGEPFGSAAAISFSEKSEKGNARKHDSITSLRTIRQCVTRTTFGLSRASERRRFEAYSASGRLSRLLLLCSARIVLLLLGARTRSAFSYGTSWLSFPGYTEVEQSAEDAAGLECGRPLPRSNFGLG